MLVALPPAVDPIAMASAGDNWSLAWRPVAPQLTARPGASLLILNRGSIGLYACDVAGALGASRRLFIDPDPDRRAIAESYGAETAGSIDAIPQGLDVAVETTGRVNALACACRSRA
jgi:threonine dehydrogenase-like Zn-dependent dehydrogenase